MALQEAGFEVFYKCDKQGLSSKDIRALVTVLVLYDYQNANYILAGPVTGGLNWSK